MLGLTAWPCACKASASFAGLLDTLSLLKTWSHPKTLANYGRFDIGSANDPVVSHVIETARADHDARRALVWECVARQHQLAVLGRLGTRRPRFRPIDRLFCVIMSWWWPAWRGALVVIQPKTVLRWRRHGIALIWKYRSHGRWRGGRPRIAVENAARQGKRDARIKKSAHGVRKIAATTAANKAKLRHLASCPGKEPWSPPVNPEAAYRPPHAAAVRPSPRSRSA